ncbi:hypothetical protein DLAC_02227 [Tieghemostelium lacteum]|uniref:Cytochrome P450 family protein n=1 Tax=Tieghemostelium lacteum TaxID=361077 RepID=A0A152A4H8_TIELA|nr:hypothetical protein DLAC_02227 [Tieghemostelium lacteum]|eukprot:KYR01124.1 hypothetical protein DLAC_02227 [Tieghemostelium lacteum]
MIQIILVLFIIYLIYSFIKKNQKSHNDQLPFALPVLGHVHLFGTEPIHRALMNLMNRMKIKNLKVWFGDNHTLIVMDPVLLREIYINNFDIFSSRFHSPVLEWASDGYRGISGSSGEEWKQNKSKVISAFSNTNIKKSMHVLEDQCQKFIKALESHCTTSELFNPRSYCQKYTMNVLTKSIYSLEVPYNDTKTKESERVSHLLKCMDKSFKITGEFSPLDMFEIIAPFRRLYLTWFRPEQQIAKAYIRDIYNDHLSTFDKENPRDLMDHLISVTDTNSKDEVDNLCRIGMELMAAGSETSSSTIEWFIILMANYPNIQEKLYAEVKEITLTNGMITLSNRQSTPYVNACIKESMRYKPTGPFNLPRIASQDITLHDVFIPKGTQILHFHYGMCQSEEYWLSPNEFLPERFINNNHSDTFKPFSLGTRNCVGVNLAQDELYLAIANMLLNFKISPPFENTKIDETELLGLTFHCNPFNIKFEKRIK